MDATLTAFVAHINSGKATIGLNSVQAYAGDLAPDAKKLIAKLPACHVMFIAGKPIAEDRTQQFDCLIITASHAFNKPGKQLDALEISSKLAEWLIDDDNINFNLTEDDEILERFYIYNGDDDITARMILQDNRYTVIALSVLVGRG